jgi:lipoprotein NlpI
MWYKEEGISKECIEIYDVERQGKTYTQQTKKKKKLALYGIQSLLPQKTKAKFYQQGTNNPFTNLKLFL